MVGSDDGSQTVTSWTVLLFKGELWTEDVAVDAELDDGSNVEEETDEEVEE